jgi:hypothetical protein
MKGKIFKPKGNWYIKLHLLNVSSNKKGKEGMI